MNAGPQPGAGPGNRPGQMTAVMRAMSVAQGPKVLRIGLVQGGRVIEERIIKQRVTVTVGSNEKSMFVIPSQAIPPMFKLFELVGNDYHLNFLDGMNGRIALATGITDIQSLRGQAKKVGGAYQVKLTDEARGKVVVGETTFLFQFVAPPPVQPRPQLPLAVKGGIASTIDWTLTIIAAFSFLLHFGIVGAMYSDWMDPIVGDDFNVAGLVDMMKNIPPPPVVETPETNTQATATATATAAATAAPKGGAGGAKSGSAGKSAG
ncbi:MAG: energy transducer TonB, partial [Polyangiales bacterium]